MPREETRAVKVENSEINKEIDQDTTIRKITLDPNFLFHKKPVTKFLKIEVVKEEEVAVIEAEDR